MYHSTAAAETKSKMAAPMRRRLHLVWSSFVLLNHFDVLPPKRLMTTPEAEDVVVVRLPNIAGHAGRHNDVIYARTRTSVAFTSRVVFFGGDVQDYVERMEAHRDNFRHSKWNLESTARLLAAAFLDSDVLVVRPSRMFLSTFSCYDNLVRSSRNGAPTHEPSYGAVDHLAALVDNAAAAVEGQRPLPLILIGFSKGCVVLNQLVHEMHHGRDDPGVSRFTSAVSAMYWLDGGHAGGSDVWLTDPKVLEVLVHAEIAVRVHVTPYQVEDCDRPWIRREEKLFSATLRKLGATDFQRALHFHGQPSSIDMHFALLAEFKKANAAVM